MRINRYLANASGMSRRTADVAISHGRVLLNGRPAQPGDEVGENDVVEMDGQIMNLAKLQTILLNKPVGFVVSRNGQGSKTVYDILPNELHHLKPVGRLDKDSSGLLLMTNNGQLAQTLTHPSAGKLKVYQVEISGNLSAADIEQITERGVTLNDGSSRLKLEHIDNRSWLVTMNEGRNRQIRRTFEKIGYKVTALHRIQFGSYRLAGLQQGQWQYCKAL